MILFDPIFKLSLETLPFPVKTTDRVPCRLPRAVFLLFYFSILLGISSFSNAQKPTFENTLAYINKKVGPNAKVEIRKGNIYAKYYKSGKQVREDQVYLPELEIERAGYDSDFTLFYIPCIRSVENCVRRSFANGDLIEYPRITFIVENNEKTLKGLRSAFLHIQKMLVQKGYAEEITLE